MIHPAMTLVKAREWAHSTSTASTTQQLTQFPSYNTTSALKTHAGKTPHFAEGAVTTCCKPLAHEIATWRIFEEWQDNKK